MSSDRPNGAAEKRSIRVTVAGHEFEIAPCQDKPGHCYYHWITSPEPDFRFSCRSAHGRELEMRDHIDAIRNVLSLINPETGVID